MCEDEYEKVVEEYRDMINGLFLIIIERSEQKSAEITNLRLRIEKYKQDESMRQMRDAIKSDG